MANITALLAALSNLPPMNGAPPLTPLPATVTPPTDFNLPTSIAPLEPPPGAPSAPLDQNLIAQYLAMLGPAPAQPPTLAPASKLDRIAAVLSGISAGIQGQGPQFAASLRAERERPQREYEAKLDRYYQQRAQFGLRGLEAAQSAEERRQTRQTAEADRRFELDVQNRARELGLRDQKEIEMFRDTMLAKRQREDDERQFARQQAADKAKQERDARLFASKFSTGGASATIAKELGNYYAGLTDQVSPAAAKWESASAKANNIRAAREARLLAGGGRGGGAGSSVAAQKALAQFESVKQQVADAVARGDATAEMQLRRTMNAAFNRLARFPGQFDLSYDQTGQWPSAKPRGAAQAGAAQPGAIPLDWHAPMALPDQGQAAPAGGMNRAQAKAKLMANGYKPAEAEAELNRLGIK